MIKDVQHVSLSPKDTWAVAVINNNSLQRGHSLVGIPRNLIRIQSQRNVFPLV
jgi:hypothetical protein